jgi:hypothetical protein
VASPSPLQVSGYEFPQIDLTPIIGIALLITTALLIASSSWR